jgi:beta-lactamase superfamily II metal-dependent hydrolase
MTLTLLSPDAQKINDMAAKWEEDVQKFELNPGDLEKAWEQLIEMKKYKVVDGVLGGTDDLTEKVTSQLKTDQSLANGTSIAFLAEFDGKSCLFLADAHRDLICESIKKLIPSGEKRLKVDAVKVSHHGSEHNISEDLIKLIDAKHYLISTNGSIHKHPDKSSIEKIIKGSKRDPELWFNYKTEYTSPWSEGPSNSARKYVSHFPKTKEGGILIEL